jgi:hypothetical protein
LKCCERLGTGGLVPGLGSAASFKFVVAEERVLRRAQAIGVLDEAEEEGARMLWSAVVAGAEEPVVKIKVK